MVQLRSGLYLLFLCRAIIHETVYPNGSDSPKNRQPLELLSMLHGKDDHARISRPPAPGLDVCLFISTKASRGGRCVPAAPLSCQARCPASHPDLFRTPGFQDSGAARMLAEMMVKECDPV